MISGHGQQVLFWMAPCCEGCHGRPDAHASCLQLFQSVNPSMAAVHPSTAPSVAVMAVCESCGEQPLHSTPAFIYSAYEEAGSCAFIWASSALGQQLP
jgi:hypothetical protein